MSAEHDVQRVVAENAIKELRSRYARHLDAGEWDKWAGLFTEDTTVEFGGFEPLEGRKEVLEFARETIDGMYNYSRHTAQMPRLDVDGDTATGNWYLIVFYEWPDGTEGTVTGYYADTYRRVDGEWKFDYVENVIENDTGEGEPHL
jgi:uncharacterized protein (TIGR02246 family)